MAIDHHAGKRRKSTDGGLQIEVQWYHYVAAAVAVLALCGLLAVGINRQARRVGAVAPRGVSPSSGTDEGQLPPPRRP